MKVHRKGASQGLGFGTSYCGLALEWGRRNETTIFRVRMTARRYELRICGGKICGGYEWRRCPEDRSGRAAL
jgi:hypothetical protein